MSASPFSLFKVPVKQISGHLRQPFYQRDLVEIERNDLIVFRKRELIPTLACCMRIALVHAAAFLVFLTGATGTWLVSSDFC